MRSALLLLAASCGQADTDTLDPSLPPPSPPPAIFDAGFSLRDAAPGSPAADIVPGIVDFGYVAVGSYYGRYIQAINRNDEGTTVVVLSEPSEFEVFPAELEVPAETRREINIRFVPTRSGTFDERLELDVCGAGCTTVVRLVGTSE